jgi:hypothetical protein
MQFMFCGYDDGSFCRTVIPTSALLPSGEVDLVAISRIYSAVCGLKGLRRLAARLLI